MAYLRGMCVAALVAVPAVAMEPVVTNLALVLFEFH